MIITLQNKFHNSEVRIRVSDEKKEGAFFIISKSQVRRINKVLCGASDCRCGGATELYEKWDGTGRIFDRREEE